MFSNAKRSQTAHQLQVMSPPSTLMEFSPPSTPSTLSPSPFPPLYTSSPSKSSSPMYPTFSKTGNEHLAPPCHGSHMPMPTTPEGSLARASVESVSLDQHLQHSDTGREEAMQSFIVERFLPAAKAVATDHDCTPYTASKQRSIKPPASPQTPMSKSTKNTSRLYSIPSASPTSKGVTWSSPLSRDEGEMDSFDDEEPTKSTGFFCVGLKTAISRVHKVVHPSAISISKSKSRAAPSYTHETTCDEEEDVLPKENASSQGKQRQRNAHPTTTYAISSSFPTIETIHRGRLPRYMASPRSSLPRSGWGVQDGSPCVSRTSFDSTPLHNVSVNCHSISSLGQQLRCNCFKQSPLQDTAWQCSQRPQYDRFWANCHWEHAENSPGETRIKDYCLQRAPRCTASDVSVQNPTNRASSTVCHDPIEGALRDPDYSEDDEHEFYDALDSWSSMPGDVTPLTSTLPKSPEISGSSKKWTSKEDGVAAVPGYVKAPHGLSITCKTSGCDANHEVPSKYFVEKQETHCLSCEGCASTYSAYTAAFKQKQKHGKTGVDQGKESLYGTLNGTYSLNPISTPSILDSDCQSGTHNGHKKWLSSSKPGWPLGISGFQSDTKKSCFQEQVRHNDRCVTNSVSAFTESSVSSPRVPPSPTGSWLEKAMALNASKPSTLATLQQKEKGVSARKKLEFTLSDAKKEVKWEDVVKGSQMHPDHFGFSEELRHRHPCNRNAIKPLRL